MAKQLVEIDIPNGFEFVRVGTVFKGDWYVSHYSGKAIQAESNCGETRVILRPVSVTLEPAEGWG